MAGRGSVSRSASGSSKPWADASRSRPHLPSKIDLAGSHVLLVDDRRDVRHLFQGYLEDAGAEIVCASDGRMALQKFAAMRDANREPDAVVLDMQMPVLDGYETARELRAQGYAGVIVALT